MVQSSGFTADEIWEVQFYLENKVIYMYCRWLAWSGLTLHHWTTHWFLHLTSKFLQSSLTSIDHSNHLLMTVMVPVVSLQPTTATGNSFINGFLPSLTFSFSASTCLLCLPNSLHASLRDAKWGSTSLELNSRMLNSDTRVHGHANFPPFVPPEVHPPPMHFFQGLLSKGNVLPYQITGVSCKVFQKNNVTCT